VHPVEQPDQNPGSRLSLYDVTCAVLSIALGLAVGWLDLHTTEISATILSLVPAGFLPGILQPVGAWRWALLSVAGLPIVAAIAQLTAVETAEPVHFNFRIFLVALVFALLSVYTGVLIRLAFRASRSDSK
jgi:hypothetical protein